SPTTAADASGIDHARRGTRRCHPIAATTTSPTTPANRYRPWVNGYWPDRACRLHARTAMSATSSAAGESRTTQVDGRTTDRRLATVATPSATMLTAITVTATVSGPGRRTVYHPNDPQNRSVTSPTKRREKSTTSGANPGG